MIKSQKKSLRIKNKRLLSEIELTGLVDTKPSVSADSNVISNPKSSSVFQAIISSTYTTEDSAQARESR